MIETVTHGEPLRCMCLPAIGYGTPTPLAEMPCLAVSVDDVASAPPSSRPLVE